MPVGFIGNRTKTKQERYMLSVMHGDTKYKAWVERLQSKDGSLKVLREFAQFIQSETTG